MPFACLNKCLILVIIYILEFYRKIVNNVLELQLLAAFLHALTTTLSHNYIRASFEIIYTWNVSFSLMA